jgi:hypothetical protein
MRVADSRAGRSSIAWVTGAWMVVMGACTGPAGRTSLVETTRVDPGPECALGGVRIDVGLDDNGNGNLDPGEVDRREHVCVVQADGRQSLVRVETIAAATDGACGVAGGSRVLTGVDLDDSGSLDGSEVTGTAVLCNGDDGRESLVAVDPLAPDPDGACFFGGVRVRVGLDDDGDGVLDTEETEQTADVCSLHVNENMTLVEQAVEPQGENCPLGGIRWVVGYDADGDKVLDPEEAGPPGFICNEMTVINGITTLLDMGAATGNQCAFGGHVLRSGPDTDNDGALDDEEVADVAVVCNGNDGVPTLVRMTAAAGECASGNGWTVTSGLDANRNGTLEANEVQATGLVCSGRTGDTGLNSLIRQREAGNACGPRPGVMLEVGTDDNRNGTLDPGEVDSWDVVCDGYDGFDSLVWLEEDLNFCLYGGIRVETGLDLNTNGVLDEIEVDHFAYVCDGVEGLPSLVDFAEAGPDCGGFEGFYLLTGLDLDLDGFLDDNEVERSLLVCP